MCCLFGLMDCNDHLSAKQKIKILSVLSKECEARGTDATGIAYRANGGLQIYKRPLPAHKLKFRIPAETRVMMGHTRMTTQGSEKQNWNNHPFRGSVHGAPFALAHNGVLHNDKFLRQTQKLPQSSIETDSYIAVQLIEQQRTLTFDSLRYMAEQVEGSFAFTVLGSKDELYFVKGDNPLCLYYYPQEQVYLYASTEEILRKALKHLRLPLGRSQKVVLDCGDILKISPDGEQSMERFDTSQFWLSRYDWSGFGAGHIPSRRSLSCAKTGQEEYWEDLVSVAAYYGYTPEDLDSLLRQGLTAEELEEFIYYGEI